MERSILVLFGLSLVLATSCLPCDASSACKGSSYIYDALAPDDQRAIVVNVRGDDVSIQDKRFAGQGKHSPVISGALIDCGNNRFYCIDGPLKMVIPKDLNVKAWSYNGLACKSGRDVGRLLYNIECLFNNKNAIFVEFSMVSGVIMFKNSPIGGNGSFRLRGAYGLFSPKPRCPH